MISKKIVFLFLSFFYFSLAKAEFTEDSYKCFDENGALAFSFGQYIARGGLGQEISRYERTDFSVEFATELRELNLFGFRFSGPFFIDHRNIAYENGHRTLINGEGHGGQFLFVFKPVNKIVQLEIWRWSDQPHYGHVTIAGDSLEFSKKFICE